MSKPKQTTAPNVVTQPGENFEPHPNQDELDAQAREQEAADERQRLEDEANALDAESPEAKAAKAAADEAARLATKGGISTSPAADAVNLVRMTRSEPMHPGGPTTADVPESEVASWELQDWKRA